MADWVVSLPAMCRLGAVLLAVVLLMRLRVPLGASLLVGAALLAVLFAMSWPGFARALIAGLASDATAFLVVIVVGILVFSRALDSVGQINRIMEAFRGLVGESRWTLVTFPALIGLLPMPGGAIVSAPMLDAAARGMDVGPARATAANYWFRHIWEFWFPLYPGVILTLTLTGVPTAKFILYQLPLTFCALAAGYAVILRRVRLKNGQVPAYSTAKLFDFLRELTPILIVVATVATADPLAGFAARALGTESMLLRRLPILLGLVLGCLWLAMRRGLTWSALGGIVWKRNILEMGILAAGIMMFQSVLTACGAVEVLRAEFAPWNVPLAVLVAALPFVAGLVVGIAIGYVGASFPLVIALLEPLPESARLPYYCLAFTFGYLGMMLSPLHLCLILTNEYFKSQLRHVYAYVIPLSLLIALAGAVLFVVYRSV